ncbi:MAG: NRDE family protein [Acidimicrobiales bacterium]
MCLLVVAFGLDPRVPLVVGANRDERLDRPATAMTVLRGTRPRILGGRDLEAGGTWLAVNEHGVVAGLTNRPLPDGRDRAKRTRGELPLRLATARSATEAVDAFVAGVRPADYNPAWFLVGDRHALYAVDLTDGPRPGAVALGPGLHILENAPLDAASAKTAHVRGLLEGSGPPAGDGLALRLRAVLADHEIPDAPGERSGRRAETRAACVHTPDYGTRSSTVISVPADDGVLPAVAYADGAPCTALFVDAAALWSASGADDVSGSPPGPG